jgi:hypothetical protein
MRALGFLLVSLTACFPSEPGPVGPSRGLHGRWNISITLDSAGQLSRAQPGTEVQGQLQFSPEFKPPKWKESPRAVDVDKEAGRHSEKAEFGRFRIDFSRFWDGPLGPVSSTMRLGDWPDPLTDVVGLVIDNDLVGLMLNPQYTHGGLLLAGRFTGDSVVLGTWSVRGDRSGIGGRFRMRLEGRS